MSDPTAQPQMEVYSFNYLFGVVQEILRQATPEKPIQKMGINDKIVLVTMLAFSYEAFANHCGEQAVSSWKETVERKKSPLSKITLLYKLVGEDIKSKSGDRPFQSCEQVLDIRNDLAHAKPEKIQIADTDIQDYRPSWLKKIDQLQLEDAIQDYLKVQNDLSQKLKIMSTPSLILSERIT